jgi:hypothetical protein
VIPIGLAWTLSLVSAYMVGENQPPLPPMQMQGGMTDAEVYDQISLGDPLGNMEFAEAVVHDPRRIEAMLLQRVIRPFTLAMTKLEHPHLPIEQIEGAMRHAYLERNHRMRMDGTPINACKIADANRDAWKMNADIMRVGFELQGPEAKVLQDIFVANHGDITRAFREGKQICEQAAKVAASEACHGAWQEMGAILQNMCDLVDRYAVATGAEAIDEVAFALPTTSEAMGSAAPDDLFGAYEFEEYIVTGHRAPSVGMAEYRRMGGRVFGG